MAKVGSQQPTYRWCAPYDATEGPYAARLADGYGMPPHPWQRAVLDDWLAVEPTTPGSPGMLVNSTCLLPVARQNGKNGVCDPRETWGLIFRHERILHTAHEFQTAKIAFDRLRSKFGECRGDLRARFPELNALVDRYTTSANQMVLDLKDGGHIEFRTRGSGGDMGRGGTFDLVVIDEAQAYTPEQDAALAPLNSAAPTGSPQTILMGTVPNSPNPSKGEPFARLRAAMHDSPQEGDCIHEWAAPEPGDPSDVSRWYAYNPSLGLSLLERGLRKDSRTMSAETFAMEHLGWWPEGAGAAIAVPPGAWSRCAVADPPSDGTRCFGVKFAPDGSRVCVAVALHRADGPDHVEAIFDEPTERGTAWLADWLASAQDVTAEVWVDGKSGAGDLVEKLRARDYARRGVHRPRPDEVATAAGALVMAVREGSVTHWADPGQAALDRSAATSTRRRIGDGFGFDGDSPAMLEAASLALLAARTTRRDPTIEGMIG